MPFVHVVSSAEPPAAAATDALLKELSSRLARHVGKPESYVMTCWTPEPRMTFGGTSEPTAYLEVKNIGQLRPEQTDAISADFCALISETLGVAKNRIYIEFADAKPHLWGYDGGTFA
jgi:phenylpyruvate tautomerase